MGFIITLVELAFEFGRVPMDVELALVIIYFIIVSKSLEGADWC